jgi:hypothetical protein
VSAEGSGAPILRCEECGRLWLPDDDGKSWRCYRVGNELVVYCPECAKREFDDTG